MPKYNICGVEVQFPHEAYECQLAYMSHVIQALQHGQNGLLESPTGTGKTLCLLCATLAWQKKHRTNSFPNNTSTQPSSHHPNNPNHPNQQQQQQSGNSVPVSSGATETAAEAAFSQGAQGTSGRGGADDEMLGADGGGGSVPSVSRKKPTVVYLSRTHAQLQQVIREIKSTSYRPKMCILGSREHMCIQQNVAQLRGSAQSHRCRALLKKRLCSHHLKTKGFLSDYPEVATEPHDIEDLVTIGRTKGPCPYYLSRELQAKADLIVMPYAYLLDRDKRKTLNTVDLRNSVFIFDEAHNLESSLEDNASVEITSGLLTSCMTEARKCVALANKQQLGTGGSGGGTADPETFSVLHGLLQLIERNLMEIPLAVEEGDRQDTREDKEGNSTTGGKKSADFPGSFVFEFLGKLNINIKTVNSLITTIEHAMQLLSEDASGNLGSGDAFPNADSSFAFRLEAFRAVLLTVFRSHSPHYVKSFRTHVKEWTATTPSYGGVGKRQQRRCLSWWCFNPGLLMADISDLGVRSLILTSGTLAPLPAFKAELNTPFQWMLENPHVIESSQISVSILTTGPSGVTFNSSFRTRDNTAYKMDLGNAIVNFARIIPGGLLVFFPSYSTLSSCVEAWKAQYNGTSVSVLKRLSALKEIIEEPKDSALLQQTKQQYEGLIKQNPNRGAVMLAVCRGKMSEGLDFADSFGRGVVITGIPYAQKINARVRLKREYLDENFFAAPVASARDWVNGTPTSKGLSGQQWYTLDAIRAVNQAVGRVIRHRHDYGAVLLLDERFSEPALNNTISSWMRPYLKVHKRFGEAMVSLAKFFKDNASPASISSSPADVIPSPGTSSSVPLSPTAAPHATTGKGGGEGGGGGGATGGSIPFSPNQVGMLSSQKSAGVPAGSRFGKSPVFMRPSERERESERERGTGAHLDEPEEDEKELSGEQGKRARVLRSESVRAGVKGTDERKAGDLSGGADADRSSRRENTLLNEVCSPLGASDGRTRDLSQSPTAKSGGSTGTPHGFIVQKIERERILQRQKEREAEPGSSGKTPLDIGKGGGDVASRCKKSVTVEEADDEYDDDGPSLMNFVPESVSAKATAAAAAAEEKGRGGRKACVLSDLAGLRASPSLLTRINGPDANGPQAKGAQAKGPEAKGTEAKGAQAKGAEVKGAEAKGVEERGKGGGGPGGRQGMGTWGGEGDGLGQRRRGAEGESREDTPDGKGAFQGCCNVNASQGGRHISAQYDRVKAGCAVTESRDAKTESRDAKTELRDGHRGAGPSLSHPSTHGLRSDPSRGIGETPGVNAGHRRETAQGLTSNRGVQRESEKESERESERDSEQKSERGSERESERGSERESERSGSGRKRQRKSVVESRDPIEESRHQTDSAAGIPSHGRSLQSGSVGGSMQVVSMKRVSGGGLGTRPDNGVSVEERESDASILQGGLVPRRESGLEQIDSAEGGAQGLRRESGVSGGEGETETAGGRTRVSAQGVAAPNVVDYINQVKAGLDKAELDSFKGILKEYHALQHRRKIHRIGGITGVGSGGDRGVLESSELTGEKVLQSIALLFGAPERYPVLKSFKLLLREVADKEILEEILERHPGKDLHANR